MHGVSNSNFSKCFFNEWSRRLIFKLFYFHLQVSAFFSFSIFKKVVKIYFSLRANKFLQKHCQVWLSEKISNRFWARKQVNQRANISAVKNRQVWIQRIFQAISALAIFSAVKNEKRHFESSKIKSLKLNFEKLVGNFWKRKHFVREFFGELNCIYFSIYFQKIRQVKTSNFNWRLSSRKLAYCRPIVVQTVVGANGSRLCEEADFGALNCQHSTKVDAR